MQQWWKAHLRDQHIRVVGDDRGHDDVDARAVVEVQIRPLPVSMDRDFARRCFGSVLCVEPSAAEVELVFHFAVQPGLNTGCGHGATRLWTRRARTRT